MRQQYRFFSLVVIAAAWVVASALFVQLTAEEPAIAVQPLGTASDHLVVPLCDGKSQIEVRDYKAGDRMDRARAQQVADAMMAQWKKMNPDATWEMASAATPAAKPAPAQVPSSIEQEPKMQDEIYSRFNERDFFVWKTELDKFVAEGDRIFHNADAFGGTVGVSCDMCHPHAANTHPETYPKYQVQLQRVALLRDMINWCIMHATKGMALPDDDPRIRAMEAYIIAQRKGKVIEPGKH